MSITRKFVEKLPKTDLHCHLDGSLRPETLIELAQRYQVKLPSYEREPMMAALKYGRVRANLEEYLMGFDPLLAVMQTPEDVERVAYELCEDASLENVWHLEMRYCPNHHDLKGMTPEQMIEAAIKGGNRATKDFGISVGHILCGLKHHPAGSLLDVAKLAAQYKGQGVVGFDLAGPEAGFPIRDHLEAIYFARKNHLFITLHAGESYGPQSISQAVHEAHAHRVGHGTSLPNDPELLQWVVNHRVGVEACPISNWHTGAVKSLDQHPIMKFLAANVRVSINTDNRLCSDTTITEEILALIEHFDISLENIRKLLTNGFKSAFLPYEQRCTMLSAFNQRFDELAALNGQG